MISTIVICLLIALVCAYSVLNYSKKLKNGCCGGNCGACAASGAKNIDKTALPHRTTVYINGMSCKHCATCIENAFAAHGMAAEVSLGAKCADIWSDVPCPEQEITRIISGCGYEFGGIAN